MEYLCFSCRRFWLGKEMMAWKWSSHTTKSGELSRYPRRNEKPPIILTTNTLPLSRCNDVPGQERLIKTLLENNKIYRSSLMSTFMNSNLEPRKDDGLVVNGKDATKNRSIAGSLLYTYMKTWPGLCVPVISPVSHEENPGEETFLLQNEPCDTWAERYIDTWC